MQVLYGTPLPPGLVAPTQGELRLRIDQLLLDDAINHNPFVQLFEPDASAARTSFNGERAAAAPNDVSAASAPTRSPNRFVVPMDYCAVGPIFWGETRPTAQGQPSTPQLRRGPLTMVYPIKIGRAQFRAYLQRMTSSPQGGVQLDVFVPSSYSGRPPVTVGKARLALDELRPGHAIHGWYPVLYRRSQATAAADTSTDVDVAQDAMKEIPIGKVKVSVSIEYYPTTRQPPQLAQHRRSHNNAAIGHSEVHGRALTHQYSSKHHRHVEVNGSGAAMPLPRAKTRRSARHSGRVGTSPFAFSSSSSSASTSGDGDSMAIESPNGRSLRARRASPLASALAEDLPAATQRLLEQGRRLRAQMDAAANGIDISAVPSLVGATYAARQGDDDDAAAATAVMMAVNGSGREDGVNADENGDDSVYTSEASDEENFALQLQKDYEARDSRTSQQQQQKQQTALTSYRVHTSVSPPQQQQQQQSQSQAAADSLASAESASGVATTPAAAATAAALAASSAAPVSVELCFSHFSFAQTPATADLRRLRLGVRLSRDITTKEPTPGPLSSYIHSVPFQQPCICLHFDVCSFSEDRSKLVVEAYKVVAQKEAEAEAEVEVEERDEWGARGPRHVAREELLGLSVVGLYRQSREIVFRDPVLDNSNAFAQLDLRMQPETKPTTDRDQREAQAGAAAGDSPCITPATDAVPLCSVAGTSAPPPHITDQGPLGDATDTSLSQPCVAAPPPLHTPPSVTPSPPQKSQLHSSLSLSERRRLRVVVHNAAELPRVALVQHGQRTPPAHYPLVSSGPRVLSDAGVAGAQSYAEPSSFVTIEEIYQSRQSSPATCEATQDEPASRSRANMEPMTNWYVDEARGGFYDRSVVAEQSSSPHYDYEALLQLPEVVLPVAAEEDSRTTAATHRTASVNETAHPRGTVDVLEELQLNIWHSDGSQGGSAPVAKGADSAGHTKVQQEEEHFWACAAYMGTCRVDLRPLRYLKTINGYYRVVCEGRPNNVTDQTDAEMEANTIGYVRVSVSLV